MFSTDLLRVTLLSVISSSFFFNDTATTEIYTLSLHDALPISRPSLCRARAAHQRTDQGPERAAARARAEDRKSTRLNSSHITISYAVFCLKKKKKKKIKKDTKIKNFNTQQIAHRKTLTTNEHT